MRFIDPKTLQAITTALVYPLELDGKTIKYHILESQDMKVKLILIGSFISCGFYGTMYYQGRKVSISLT